MLQNSIHELVQKAIIGADIFLKGRVTDIDTSASPHRYTVDEGRTMICLDPSVARGDSVVYAAVRDPFILGKIVDS